MTPEHAEAVRARRTEYARVRRRRLTLLRKADQFKQECGGEVYLLLFTNGRFYSYSSTTNELWPPLPSRIARSYPLPQHFTPVDFRCETPRSSPEKSTPESVPLKDATTT
ncbi:hypothetical protein F4679DRAFT_583887 [Xylaria curta]|nr:hypothetical protein F4679DRAFT_583887 [Xylaria curta]